MKQETRKFSTLTIGGMDDQIQEWIKDEGVQIDSLEFKNNKKGGFDVIVELTPLWVKATPKQQPRKFSSMTKMALTPKISVPWDGRFFGKGNKELVEWFRSLSDTDRTNIGKILEANESQTINDQKFTNWR